MKSFLGKVVEDLERKKIDLEKACFILPNKRSTQVFKNLLLEKIKTPIFAPEIESIDSLIIKISGLKELKASTALYRLFLIYSKIKTDNIDSIEIFNSWAKSFINDTIEIEQNLLNVSNILGELVEINKIKNWGERNERNKEVGVFWGLLPLLYEKFKRQLLDNQEGTKGICYSEAQKNLEHYKQANEHIKHIFVGLNALSSSEELIINELLDFNKGEIYWDIDQALLQNKNHGASYFIKKYKKKWNYYTKNQFNWSVEELSKPKTINIIGATKSVGQAKEIGRILSSIDNRKSEKIAVILGDETLIEPLLSHIPENIKEISISSSIPQGMLELKKLLNMILEIQTNKSESKVTTKDIMSSRIIRIAFPLLNTKEDKNSRFLNLILKSWESPKEGLYSLINFFEKLSTQKELSDAEIDEVKAILESLDETRVILESNTEIKTIKTLKHVITPFLDEIRLPYDSEKNVSIQIMGLLESRAIDFETVIISSVNEGFLPRGKSYESLIPFDLRKKHNLPTFNERNKTYTYHFYRLLQRAKNIYLIYNNLNEGIKGGEKSRFIHQLEIEKFENHKLVYYNATPNLSIENNMREITKSSGAMEKLKELAIKGFSPSSLESYIKNSEEFYYKNLLNIYDNDEKDEINPRTIGLIFHDSLETLYKPLVGKKILKKDILSLLSNTEDKVQESFVKNKIKNFNKGKGLIAFEVVKKAIMTLIKNEIKDIELGNEIEIISLEKRIECDLSFKKLKHPVKIKGIIDRLDKRNGVIRIIDYKTGIIRPNEVSVNEITSCFDLTHLKAMQLLCYALMYFKNHPKTTNIEAGLISFRDLNKGLIKFGTKKSLTKRDYLIDLEKINEFEESVKELILEIMDPNLPFKSV